MKGMTVLYVCISHNVHKREYSWGARWRVGSAFASRLQTKQETSGLMARFA